MSDAALVLRLTRFGFTTLLRNPRVVVFSIAFPLVLLVLFNGIFSSGSDATTGFHGGEIDTSAYFTAGIAAYAIMMSAFSTLAVSLTTQRETGQLKRLRGTPMPAWTFMLAQVLRSVGLALAMVVALFAIGELAFGVRVRADAVPGLLIYVVLGTATLAVLGIALTPFANTAESASTIAPFTAVMLSFVSGVFIPVATLPTWLEDIGRVFPLYHLADGLQRCVADHLSGTGLTGPNLAVLGVWAVGGLVIAVRRFRWEPMGTRG